MSTELYEMELREKSLKEGMEKGLKEGMEKGIEKGKTEGVKQTLIASVKSLVKTLGLTTEQAMDALSVPAETRAKLQTLL